MEPIDSIKFKRDAAQRVMKKLDEMSVEQQLEFWQKRFDELNDKICRVREHQQLYGNTGANAIQ